MIESTVVGTRQRALSILGNPAWGARTVLPQPHNEDMPALLELRGDERQALAVGGETRFQIHRAVLGERTGFERIQFEQP